MRYKQRIIEHNIDVPKNVPSDTIELNEIKYDPSVISHHPKSFEYFFTHGILINDERYIIKEFYVKNEDVYAVVTKDEIKYFELRMNYCSKPVLDKIIEDLAKVKNAVDNNAPVLNGRTLTVNGSSVELPDDTQELSIRDHKLILSKGNSVELPEYDDSEVKNRLNTLETKEDNDKQTLSINERTISISNGNSIELPEDKDTVYDDTNIKRRLQTLETKPDKDSQTLSLEGRTLSISDGNYVTLPEDRDTVYNDSELLRRLNALENKTDKFVSGASVTREGNKIVITYTFSTGENKIIEFEDHDTLGVAYDDTAIIERLKALESKQDKDTVYDDREIKERITRLESKPDKDTIYNDSELRGKIEDLSSKETAVESRVAQLEKRPVASNYDDSDVLRRLGVLESKPDRDNQTLSYDNSTGRLSITGGNSITIQKDDNPILRISKSTIPGTAVPLSNSETTLDNILNPLKIKFGDVIQDVKTFPDSGITELNYWKVNGVEGNKITLVFLGKKSFGNYNDTEIKRRITALEGKTDNFVTGVTASRAGNKVRLTYNFVTGDPKIVEFDDKDTVGIAYDDTVIRTRIKTLEDRPSGVVHRFYNGDISGRAETSTIVTVKRSNFRNPDGIKVGDTVEDFWTDQSIVNRGIWKVIEVAGDNIKVQGIGNYDTNIRKNLSLNANTRVLSIDGGNSVTLPNDKQTISKNGNKIVLSNGGGEVDIPQPNLSGYVPIAEYNKLKGALEKLLTDLKNSGAWNQTGSTVFDGEFYNNRHIATGNINVFGGTPDGGSFIRTSNNKTENDLAGG